MIKIFKSSKHKNLAYFLCLFMCLLFTQKDLITHDPILTYDDPLLLDPIKNLKIESFGEYIGHIKSGRILDIQPIRDLSFKLDDLIFKNTGIGVYHLTNNLIWIVICLLFFNILLFLGTRLNVSYLLTSLFAFHPCLSNALFWISARKHLLSTLFTLAATYFLLVGLKSKSLKYFIGLGLCYLFACFSQPINIGWPVAAVALIYCDNRQNFKSPLILITLTFLAVISVGVFFINHQYYDSIYTNFALHPKFTPGMDISFNLLIFGRLFLQSLLPFWPTPTPYYPGELLNILGMGLFVIFFYYFVKRDQKNLVWIIFASLPALVISVKVTNTFGMDCYLPIMVSGTLILIASESKEWRPVFYLPTGLILLSVFLLLFFRQSKAWQSSESLFAYAFEKEATPFNLTILSNIQYKNGDYVSSFKGAKRLLAWDGGTKDADILFSQSIISLPNTTDETKINLLKEGIDFCQICSWSRYHLAGIYAKKSDFKIAYETLASMNRHDFLRYEKSLSIVGAEFLYMCSRSQPNCTEVKNKIEILKKVGSKFWNERVFQDRLKVLNVR